jgi:hypothetical protein
MIDNPRQVTELLAKLQAALPIPAVMTTALAASLRKRMPDPPITRDCEVVFVANLGDEGGIMCQIAAGGVVDEQRPLLTSITHLDFHPRLALARDIAAYKKHRVKKLRRNGGWGIAQA